MSYSFLEDKCSVDDSLGCQVSTFQVCLTKIEKNRQYKYRTI